MFRILRIVRVFHALPELMKLVQGFMDSLKLVMWIAVLMFLIILVMAIITTDFIGNRADAFDEADQKDIEANWGTVKKSMITLFQYLTLDGWSEMSRQVWTNPAFGWIWQLFFDIYVLVMAFVMLSLLTGVIADNMTKVSTAEK